MTFSELRKGDKIELLGDRVGVVMSDPVRGMCRHHLSIDIKLPEGRVQWTELPPDAEVHLVVE